MKWKPLNFGFNLKVYLRLKENGHYVPQNNFRENIRIQAIFNFSVGYTNVHNRYLIDI